jgi:hypothetical protein
MNTFAENENTATATITTPEPYVEEDMVQVMEETRLKCLNMIEQAASAISVVCGNTRIILPDVLKFPREPARQAQHEIVAVAMRTPSKWFWQKQQPSEAVFYFRNDYEYTKRREYAKSESVSLTERELLRSLDRRGWWGLFLKANEHFLDNLKIAIEEGKRNEYPDSPVKDLDWLKWNT